MFPETFHTLQILPDPPSPTPVAHHNAPQHVSIFFESGLFAPTLSSRETLNNHGTVILLPRNLYGFTPM